MFCKKGVLRNFAKFTWKHLRQGYFFHKIADARNFIKNETLTQVSSCEFCGFSKNTFFTEHLRTTVSASLDYALTSCGIWLNADFATWNLLMENITPVSTIAFKVHVVMTLVFQKKCDVKFLHWHEICSSWEKTFQIAFNSIWLIFAEINQHCQEMFGIFFSKPIIVGPGTLIVALFVAATSLRDFFYPPPEVGKFTEEWWDNMRAEQGRWLLLIFFQLFRIIQCCSLSLYQMLDRVLNTLPLYMFEALTRFMSLVSFYTPWKHRKTSGFLMLLGVGVERDKWNEMG